jgi:hypothetical protein
MRLVDAVAHGCIPVIVQVQQLGTNGCSYRTCSKQKIDVTTFTFLICHRSHPVHMGSTN